MCEPHPARHVYIARCASLAVLENGVYPPDYLSELPPDDFARRHVALRLPFHLPRASVARVPGVRFAAAHGALLRLWCDGEIT